MAQLALFLQLLVLLLISVLALRYKHWQKERARKLAELNAYWDSLTVARPPWLPDVTQ